MSAHDFERRLRRLTWPAPAAAVRTRVLSSAGRAAAPPVSWVDRVWFSQAWRLAAAATVAGLVAVEAWSMSSAAGEVMAGRPLWSASAQALDDLGLPDDAVVALTSRAPQPDARPALALADLTGDRR